MAIDDNELAAAVAASLTEPAPAAPPPSDEPIESPPPDEPVPPPSSDEPAELPPSDEPIEAVKPTAVKPTAVKPEVLAAADPLNDPLPNAMKRETKERITNLISMTREVTTARDTAVQQRDEVLGLIRETQATPEQYGQALDYLRMVNSTSRADREQALQMMQQEVTTLARMLGKNVPGVNFLEGHQDLIDGVGSGRIALEHAQELAAAREAAKYQQGEADARTQAQANTNWQQQARSAGVAALNTLETRLRADPYYAQKRPILIAQLKPVLSRIAPNQWAATFKAAYDALPAAALMPRAAAAAGNTPLRASNPAGSPAPAPKSALEAVQQALSSAN